MATEMGDSTFDMLSALIAGAVLAFERIHVNCCTTIMRRLLSCLWVLLQMERKTNVCKLCCILTSHANVDSALVSPHLST